MQRWLRSATFKRLDCCCDAFSILHLDELNVDIELCQAPLSLIRELRAELRYNSDHTTNTDDCLMEGRVISRTFRLIIGGFETADLLVNLNFSNEGSFSKVLNICALTAQLLCLGVLSYSQAHVGKEQPKFVVDPLEEIYLLGSSLTGSHVVMELLDFTCMKGMIHEPVLVFRLSDDDSPSAKSYKATTSKEVQRSPEVSSTLHQRPRYDLLASCDDLADTLGQARFIAELPQPKYLFAIEIGGGTISVTDGTIGELHWRAGQTLLKVYGTAFNSDEKVLIGGTTINDICPLDEHGSWRDPLTNAYIQHLDTRDHTWELRETQAELQGVQYVVFQCNSTYIKQNGVTLKQQQLMLPFGEIDLTFLYCTCGLQVSFCTGVARRAALCELLADVMVPFVESRLSKPEYWEKLKSTHSIVTNFREGDLEK